ncbi:glycine oxidase ThiO [Cohnella ginsengisoli]|uniref:glycine oxidase n=1 Tax=Cohnella ginsengisoli TaxID=425004 RepID=A0A9X4KE84_9BACL|nr:glycine oxidase ThiO [Cohnella ginsengisoli]MDG0790418.1 glycine oxidase ThiO [Cohnella ginsengisoli]
MKRTLLVLGGGIVGLSCAYEALKQGWRAIVVDRGEIGGQASGAAAGMLAPFYENGDGPDAFFRLCMDSFARYPAWTAEIEDVAGARAGFVRSGSLHVAYREADRLPLFGRLAWQARHSAGLEWLDEAALSRIEPSLPPGLAGALYCPEEAHVQAPLLVKVLAGACERLGARLLPLAGELTDIGQGAAGGLSARFEAHGTIGADALCCCLGAWSGLLADWLRLRIPVHPIRGQICAYDPAPVSLRHIVFGPQAYWVGKPDGSLVCGASEDEAGFDRTVTAGGIGRLVRAGGRMFPVLAGAAPARSWAGLRPATLDGWPLIGPAPGRSGVFVAAGHYRNGILLSPATSAAFGRWLAAGGGAGGDEASEAFRPDRFGVRGTGERWAATPV